MKRLFLIGVMVLTAVAGFAQSGERIDTLKERQKVLKITTKLNKLQLDYEKEKANNIELSKAQTRTRSIYQYAIKIRIPVIR